MRVLDDSGGFEVEWADGRRMTARRGGAVRRVRAGSLGELYASAPEQFAGALSSDPLSVFLAALRSSDDDVKPTELQSRVGEFLVDSAAVKDAWKSVQNQFTKNPHVVKGTRPGSYRWSDAAVDPLSWIDELDAVEAAARRVEARTGSAEAHRLDARLSSFTDEALSAAARWILWAGDLGESPEVPDLGQTISLDEKAARLLLQRAKTTGRFDVLTWLAAAPSSSRAAEAATAALSHEAASQLLQVVTDGALRTSTAGQRAEPWMCATLTRLAARDGDVDKSVLERVILLRLRGCAAADAPVVDACDGFLTPKSISLEELGAVLNRQPDLRPEQLALGPLHVGSARLRCIQSLRSGPWDELVHRSETWAGLTIDVVDTLARAAHPLSDALLEGDAAPGVAVAHQWLRSAPASLAALGQAFSWSPALVRAVDTAALQRLVQQARTAGALEEQLLSDPQVPELKARLASKDSEARAASAGLQTRVDELVESLSLSDRRLAAAEEMLRAGHSESTSAYASQLRQAKIDTIRVLCSVLDQLRETEDGHRVWADAVSLAAKAGVAPLGTVGDVILVDPTQHEIMGAGSSREATVRRPGYEWIDHDERVVITKALVTPET